MKRHAVLLLAASLSGLLLASPARAGSVVGRVLDAGGKPLAGAKVQWLPYRDEDEILLDLSKGEDPSPLGETKTDAQGRFRVSLDKPGLSVALRIVPQGLPSARFSGPFDASEESDLADIQVPAALAVSGQVVDEAGKPVAGARVLAVGSEALFENDVQMYSQTRTAADGSFAMADAPGGARVLIAAAPGLTRASHVQIQARGEERFVLARGGTIRGTLLDAAGKPAAGAIVTAGEAAAQTDAAGGYEISGVSAGLLRVQTIWKEDFAARADSVRVRKGETVELPLKLARAALVSGSAVDEKTKKPISGVRISVYTPGPNLMGRRRAERASRTDAHGRFRVGGLANRPYLLEASREGYLPTSIPNLSVSVGKPSTAHLALRRAASVAGRVVDEKGQPVSGASVSLNEGFSGRTFRARGLAAAMPALLGRNVVTGPDGSFRLRNVTPARNAELEATRSGFAAARQPGVTLKSGDAVQGLSLVLRKGLAARGQVVDGQGKPVGGAELRVALRETGARGMRVQLRMLGMGREKPDAVSAPDGAFVIGGLSPGQYSAAVSRDGFAPKSVPSLDVKAAGENVWPPIALAAGISVAGVVRDSAGQAVPGARILAIDPGAGARPLDSSSGPDGRFRLDNLAADRPLMLNVSADGFATVQKNVTPPAQDLAITLKSSGTIRGRVEDADGKTPVTDFIIGRKAGGGGGRFVLQVGGNGGDRPFHSDDGTFELTDVPPGKWTVHASAEGYRPSDVGGVEVAEGAAKEGVVFSLKRGGSLAGRVLDPQLGTGVPNASVSYQGGGTGGGGMGGGPLMRMGGAGTSQTTTDADGKFSFDGVADGKIMLTATHPDYLDVTQEVDTSRQTSVDLTLGTGASISGTVVGQDGRSPIPGAQVSLNPEGDAQTRFSNDSTHADGAGNFLFEHLQAGRFQLVAQSSDGKTITQEVGLSESQRLTGVLLQMTTGALLQGTVTGLPAGRLGGVRINANAENYNDSTTTDDSGKFTLPNVPSGVVGLRATTSFLSGRSTSTTVEIPSGAAQFTATIEFQGASRLSGRVTRGDTGLSGVMVFANPLTPTGGAGRSNAQTDDNGQYSLEGLTDGDYAVSLSGQGVSYRKTFTVSGDTPGDIALPPIQLTGTVTEAGSGEPLDSATIQMQLQPAPGQSGTGGFAMKMASGDSTGRYFVDDVDSGSYQVTARRDGYQAKTQTLEVGGDSANLDFALPRGEGISLRIVDGLTGVPLRGVIASAVDASGTVGYQGSLSLDSTGKGEISSLAPGRYAVHLFSDGYATRTGVIDAPSPLVPVALTPGGRVEVAVAVPLTGRLVDSSGMAYPTGPYRPDGRVAGSPPLVTWEHISPGSYQLLVGAPGAEVPYPFSVIEGQTTRVTVQ